MKRKTESRDGRAWMQAVILALVLVYPPLYGELMAGVSYSRGSVSANLQALDAVLSIDPTTGAVESSVGLKTSAGKYVWTDASRPRDVGETYRVFNDLGNGVFQTVASSQAIYTGDIVVTSGKKVTTDTVESNTGQTLVLNGLSGSVHVKSNGNLRLAAAPIKTEVYSYPLRGNAGLQATKYEDSNGSGPASFPDGIESAGDATIDGSVYLKEKAAGADKAGYAQLHGKDETGVNSLIFVNDSGTPTTVAP